MAKKVEQLCAPFIQKYLFHIYSGQELRRLVAQAFLPWVTPFKLGFFALFK